MLVVAVEKRTAKGSVSSPGPGMWLEKLFLKKFQDCWPSTENMATWRRKV